jgi:8-oxo-dGTP pyrophosphatase MutT (NUDIX family)
MHKEKWKTLSSEYVGDFHVFKLYKVQREHPVSHKISTFTSLQSNDWVNIIPITEKNEVILVEQYRHGTDEVSIEIPAGIIETDEKPILAAKRECIEETGYCSDSEPILIGSVKPNPAFLDNTCYHFLWKNVEQRYPQHLDENEDINVLKLPLNDFVERINSGNIKHSLVMSAMFFFEQYLKQHTYSTEHI